MSALLSVSGELSQSWCSSMGLSPQGHPCGVQERPVLCLRAGTSVWCKLGLGPFWKEHTRTWSCFVSLGLKYRLLKNSQHDK